MIQGSTPKEGNDGSLKNLSGPMTRTNFKDPRKKKINMD